MKLKWMIVFFLLTMVIASACQATPTPIAVQEAEQMQVDSSVQEGVGAGEVTYPEPGSEVEEMMAELPSLPEVLYPMYGDEAQVMWSQAQAMILNGEVERILQNESLQITLLLKDGRTIFSSVTNLDDVISLIEKCGAPCKDISIENE